LIACKSGHFKIWDFFIFNPDFSVQLKNLPGRPPKQDKSLFGGVNEDMIFKIFHLMHETKF
jgi:hypothetical protein